MKSERYRKIFVISVVIVMVGGVAGAVNIVANSANDAEYEALDSDGTSSRDDSSISIIEHPKMSTQVLKHVPPPGIAGDEERVLVNIYLTENRAEYIEELKNHTIDIWYVEDYKVVAEVYNTEIEDIADLPFVSYIVTPVITEPLQIEGEALSQSFESIIEHPKMSTQVLKHVPPLGIAGDEQRVLVNIYLIADRAEYIEELKNYTIDIWYVEDYKVVAEVYNTEIEDIADLPFVSYIDKPVITEPLQPEMNANEAVKWLGSDTISNPTRGEGVKIAVLDHGFYGYENANLPKDLINKSFRHDGDIRGGYYTEGYNVRHGTACAEVVHAVAPEAKLYLVNYRIYEELRDAILYLISEDVDIISHSMGSVVGAFDGSDPTFIFSVVFYHDITWVNAAGNYAQMHWEGTFNDTDGDGWHEFPSAGGETGLTFTAERDEKVTLRLSWNDSWEGYATQDYNLYIKDSDGEDVGDKYNPSCSLIRQRGYPEDLPYEVIADFKAPYTGTYYIMIENKSATKPVHFELYSKEHELEPYVENSSLCVEATAFGAIVAGAVNCETSELEPYSSRGPTNDGRTKPDFVAPVGYGTSVYSAFRGTSAAAPYIAGGFSDVLSNLKTIHPGSKDNLFGYGLPIFCCP